MPNEKSELSESEHFDVILEDVETGVRPRKIKPAEKKKSAVGSGWQYTSLAGEIGFDVAVPMVAGLIIGAKLDERWGTQPKATLLLFGLGLLFSCASLIRIVRDVLNKR